MNLFVYLKFFLFYVLFYTVKEIENIFSCVPIHYRNTHGCLGQLEKAWKQLLSLWVRVSISISCSPKLPLVFL